MTVGYVYRFDSFGDGLFTEMRVTNMITYYGTGIAKDYPNLLDESTEFGIQEIEMDHYAERYTYPNDSIKFQLDIELVNLYDLFRDLIFPDTEQYYGEAMCLPIWIQEAGQDSDCAISADLFSEWILKSDIPNLYRHLYLVDCQFLIGAVQNLLCAMEDAFINYFKKISTFNLDERYKEKIELNDTVMILSEDSTLVSSYIETYFTKAYSVLDIMCKICYEIQYLRTEFDSYQKIKSADVLWGARKKLRINGTENTIFEKCEFISNIEAIRNEIVHNGTWELRPKVFVRLENYVEVERFMLFPDMAQGHLSTVKNRRHFFSSSNKINNILPRIHLDFKNRLLKTVKELLNNKRYHYADNTRDTNV